MASRHSFVGPDIVAAFIPRVALGSLDPAAGVMTQRNQWENNPPGRCASLRTALWASFLPRPSPQPVGTVVTRRTSRPSRLLAGAGPAAPVGR